MNIHMNPHAIKKMTIRELRHSLDRIYAHEICKSDYIVELNTIAITNLVQECKIYNDTYLGMDCDEYETYVYNAGFSPLLRCGSMRIYCKCGMVLSVSLIGKQILTCNLILNGDKQIIHCENGFNDCMEEIKELNIKPFDYNFIIHNDFLFNLGLILTNDELNQILATE